MMHSPSHPELPLPPSAEGHMTRRAFEHLKSSCDAEALLRRAGLTLQGIEDPQARIGAESQIAFLKLASEALDDPLLGFHLAESFEPRELGLLYYVQASSATLGEALGRVARYRSVAHEGVAAKSVRGNALTFRIDYVGVPRHTDRHQMEFLVTGLVRIFRKLTNTHLRPIRVRLAHPRCAASAALEKFLGQSIEFGAGHDEMTFVGAAADLPVVSADPYLNEALVRYWEDALDRRGSAQRPLRAAVENAILPLLPHGKARISRVRQAVRIGVPIEELTSFSRFLDPNLVERVIDSYREKDGGEPKTYTIDLSWKLLSIARQTRCLDEEGIEQLDELRADLEQDREGGLTEKNLTVIRQVMTASVWGEVLRVPARLMQEARDLKHQAPVKAALRAQLAVAIGILTVAPIRLGNLARIRLEENLIRPSGPLLPYWLVFPNYDVKNRVKLEFDLKERLTKLIDEYVHEHRPALVRGSNAAWLFPGENGRHKTLATLGDQITNAVLDRVGIRVTPHQYRHAAGAIIIRTTQDYEFARRVLGHKNVRTTIKFYLGLETAHATERFGDIVRAQLSAEALEGVASW
jgi:integrase